MSPGRVPLRWLTLRRIYNPSHPSRGFEIHIKDNSVSHLFYDRVDEYSEYYCKNCSDKIKRRSSRNIDWL